MALTACGSSGDSGGDDARPSSSPASTSPAPEPATSSADPQQAAKDEVLDSYRHYWAEMTAAYEKASVEGTDLKKYAVAQAYSSAENEMKSIKAKGLVARGKPTLSPKVTSLDTTLKVPRSEVTDCTDTSKWKLIEKSSGKEASLPKGRKTKYITKATAEKWYGRWVIVQVTPENTAC